MVRNCCSSRLRTRAVGPYRDALKADGIPGAQFQVDDLAAEHERLVAAGVNFTMEPMEFDGNKIAVFDDTCGNLIQLIEPAAQSGG